MDTNSAVPIGEWIALGYAVAVIAGIIYSIAWLLALLKLVQNTAKLAKACTDWLNTNQSIVKLVPVVPPPLPQGNGPDQK